MGERLQSTLFRPQFNRAVVAEVAGSDLTADAGALVMREAAGQLGVLGVLEALHDPRDPALTRYSMPELLLGRLLTIGQGWYDQDDLDALRTDPALRVAVSTRRGEAASKQPLPSQPTMSRLASNLACDHNRDVLRDGLLEVGLRRAAEDRGRSDRLIIDIDSFPDYAHGNQEGVRYNGHYGDTCFHPLVAFADTGDVLAIDLRPGNVHTAEDTQPFIEPVIAAAKRQFASVWLRFDAGYASGAFFDWLDDQGVRFLTRLRSNAVLQRQVQAWKDRSVARWQRTRVAGSTPREATFEFWYKAKDWARQRRVVAVLVERSDRDGELFEHVFFLATNAARPEASSARLLERYRKRGLAEARIGELVNEFIPPLSSPTLDINEGTLRLAAIAYQVAHLLRRRLEKHRNEGLSMRRLRERFLKAAAVLVRHARRLVFRISKAFSIAWQQIAEVLGSPPELQTSLEGAAR